MKKTHLFPALLLSLFLMASCSKGVDININDPQHIEYLDIIPSDLVEAFGQRNIHFGHTPPNLNNVCFYVDGLEYKVCQHYIYGPNNQPVLSNFPLDYDPIKYYHCFFNHIENIASDSLLYYGPGEDRFMMEYDNVFVIGSEKDSSVFTAYFIERPNSKYHPTNGILISGTLFKDTIIDTTFYNNNTIIDTTILEGIKNFRMGKKIIEYKDPLPAILDVYLPGSIDVKVKDTAQFFLRDTCTRWQQYN